MLSRDEILRCSALPSEELSVPEWGGSVRVRSLTAGERDVFEIEMKDARSHGQVPNVPAALAVKVLTDEAGKRLFTDADAETLTAYHAKPLDRVFNLAARLSGITKDDVEQLEKN